MSKAGFSAPKKKAPFGRKKIFMGRSNKDINKEASIPTLPNPYWVEAPDELPEPLRKEYNSIVKELFILSTVSIFASSDYSKVLNSRFEQLWGRLGEIRMLIT